MDIFQEVFLTVFRRLPDFRRRRGWRAFRPWLHRIARNKVGDYLRREGRRPRAAGGDEACERLLRVADRHEADQGDADERARVAWQALKVIGREVEPATWEAARRLIAGSRPRRSPRRWAGRPTRSGSPRRASWGGSATSWRGSRSGTRPEITPAMARGQTHDRRSRGDPDRPAPRLPDARGPAPVRHRRPAPRLSRAGRPPPGRLPGLRLGPRGGRRPHRRAGPGLATYARFAPGIRGGQGPVGVNERLLEEPVGLLCPGPQSGLVEDLHL